MPSAIERRSTERRANERRAFQGEPLVDRLIHVGTLAGLGMSILPLTVLALASLPVSIPVLFLGKSRPCDGITPMLVVAGLPLAPALAVLGFQRSSMWRERRRNRRAEAHKRAHLSPLDARLMAAIDEANLEKAAACLDQGADLEARDSQGSTPLILGAFCGDPLGMAKLLLERGAKLEAINEFGVDALLAASHAGCRETAQALLRAGARKRNPSEEMTFEAYALRVGAQSWERWVSERQAEMDGTPLPGRAEIAKPAEAPSHPENAADPAPPARLPATIEEIAISQ
jgi:hypothetical protein